MLSAINITLATEMAPRLFDLDLQLFADAVLMIIAVVTLFLVMSYFLFNPARAFLEKRQEKQSVGEKLINSIILKFKFFGQQNISCCC